MGFIALINFYFIIFSDLFIYLFIYLFIFNFIFSTLVIKSIIFALRSRPGAYVLPGGVATLTKGSPYRNSPAPSLSGRNKFGSPW